jgi:hypothetical protein
VSAYAGFTLNSPQESDVNTGFIGESGFYGPGAGVVNLGVTFSKTIKISDSFELPLTGSLITNPLTNKIYYVVGISF